MPYRRLSQAIKADISNVKDSLRDVADGVAELRIGQSGKEIESLSGPLSLFLYNIGERREKIHRWLSAPDPSSNQNQAYRKRQGTTGSWFLNSNHYADWKTTSDSLLWLHGIPGCGKTILSSAIVEDVLCYCDTRPTLAVTYFYFDFNDDAKQRHQEMLRSLLWQLSFQSTDAFEGLHSLFDSCGGGAGQPTHEALLMNLKKVMQGFEETFVVLDALDECKERFELLQDIRTITAWELRKLHIIATSRRQNDIEESLSPLCKDQDRICIQSAVVNNDIRAYVQERLLTDPRLKRWQNHPTVREEIEITLMEKADGM